MNDYWMTYESNPLINVQSLSLGLPNSERSNKPRQFHPQLTVAYKSGTLLDIMLNQQWINCWESNYSDQAEFISMLVSRKIRILGGLHFK